MRTAIRNATAFVGAIFVAAGTPLHAQSHPDSGESQSSAEGPQSDATDESPNQDFYCGARKLGTWFYCDKPKTRPSAKPASAVTSTAASERLARSEEHTSALQSLK